MNRYGIPAIVACLLLSTTAVHAQEKFTVKLKERGEGETAVIKKNDMTVTKVIVTDANGQVLFNQNEAKGQNIEFKETILKRQAGKMPTKWQREYAKDSATKDKETKDGPLTGMTVIIEKKGDMYLFTNKAGDKLEGEPAAALARDFGKKSDEDAEIEKMVLPQSPVKVGDSWKIDLSKIVKLLAKDGAMELDGAKSTGTGTLVKAYKKDGRQYGDMKIRMEIPMITVGKGKELLKFNPGAKIVMDIDFDVCIDGSSENGTMKMKMVMNGKADAPGAMVTLDVNLNGTQVQLDAAKK